MISASGKKKRLSTKYPKKLWPFRSATRAGQNAIAIQMMSPMMPAMNHMVSLSCAGSGRRGPAPGTIPVDAPVRRSERRML